MDLMRAIFFLHVLICGSLGVAANATESVRLFKQFDLGNGDVVLCYDKDPAFVFAPTDSHTTSSIKLVSFDGAQKEILKVAGGVLPDSLSCSDDGKTIAFVRKNEASQDYGLFIIKEGVVSEYRLSFWADEYPIEGTRSLLSEDGHGIALPGNPSHVGGPDVIGDMSLFVYENGKPFFVNNGMLFDHGKALESLSFDGKAWQRTFIIEKDPSVFLEQAGLCLDRTIALATADEAEKPGKLYDLTSGGFQKPAWLDSSHLVARAMRFGSGLVAASGYNRCLYLVERWATKHFDLKGLAAVERAGVSVFAVPKGLSGNGEETTLASRRIGLTKDGCYVLASTYVRQPQTNQDWHDAATHAVVLQLRGSSRACQ